MPGTGLDGWRQNHNFSKYHKVLDEPEIVKLLSLLFITEDLMTTMRGTPAGVYTMSQDLVTAEQFTAGALNENGHGLSSSS